MINHLHELRKRLFRILIVFLAIFSILFFFDNVLYQWLAAPIVRLAETPLIAIEVTTPFTVPLRLAFVSTFFIGMPYFFYEIWRFMAPGLYTHEKRIFLPTLVLSIVLFYLGVLFSYGVLVPLSLQFFQKITPENVTVMTDIKAYLDYVLSLLLAGGLAFQVPILTVVVNKLGIVSLEKLRHLRPYIIVSLFTVSMFLTPPDVISQILLALPMYALFELGLLLSRSSTHL